jgi:hypothetical protein
MSLIEIAYPRCPHHGYVAAAPLPAILKCSACGLEHTVRDGGYAVRSYDAERLNGAPTGSRSGRSQDCVSASSSPESCASLDRSRRLTPPIGPR